MRLSQYSLSSVVIVSAREDRVAMEGNETFQLQLEPKNILLENEFVAGPLSLTIVDDTSTTYIYVHTKITLQLASAVNEESRPHASNNAYLYSQYSHRYDHLRAVVQIVGPAIWK